MWTLIQASLLTGQFQKLSRKLSQHCVGIDSTAAKELSTLTLPLHQPPTPSILSHSNTSSRRLHAMHQSYCVLQCLTCLLSLERVGPDFDCCCVAVLGMLACKEVFRLSTRRRLPALHKLQKIWSAQLQLLYAGQAVTHCAFITSALCYMQCIRSQRAQGVHDAIT